MSYVLISMLAHSSLHLYIVCHNNYCSLRVFVTHYSKLFLVRSTKKYVTKLAQKCNMIVNSGLVGSEELLSESSVP